MVIQNTKKNIQISITEILVVGVTCIETEKHNSQINENVIGQKLLFFCKRSHVENKEV